MDFSEIPILLLIIALIYCVGLAFKHRDHWKKKNIPEYSTIPFLGHMLPYIMNQENYHTTLKRIYDHLSNTGHMYGGTFEMLRPVLVICDPTMVIAITMKHFNQFSSRDASWLFRPNNRTLNPLSDNLVSNEGNRWKIVRQPQSHVFFLPKYRKVLLEHAVHSLHEMEVMLNQYAGEIELKDLCLKYMVDVIGSWGFGIECSAYKDDGSEFLKYAKLAFDNNYKLRHLLMGVHPGITEWLRIPDFKTSVTDFYLSLVKNTIQYRRDNNVRRDDYLGVLMDMMDQLNGIGERFDELDVSANAFVTLIVGYDSTATTLAYALYELTINGLFQQTLREEISKVKDQYKGDLTLDALNEMKYLDMVVDETLRKYPTDSAIFRSCTEKFQIPNTDSWIDKGTLILMPTLGFHLDPKYFPDPEKFDPDRFSPENKKSIPNGVYFPYGEGPRICIGIRVAQLLMKIALVEIVSKYNLQSTLRTDIPLPMIGGSFVMIPKNGIWVSMSKI